MSSKIYRTRGGEGGTSKQVQIITAGTETEIREITTVDDRSRTIRARWNPRRSAKSCYGTATDGLRRVGQNNCPDLINSSQRRQRGAAGLINSAARPATTWPARGNMYLSRKCIHAGIMDENAPSRDESVYSRSLAILSIFRSRAISPSLSLCLSPSFSIRDSREDDKQCRCSFPPAIAPRKLVTVATFFMFAVSCDIDKHRGRL